MDEEAARRKAQAIVARMKPKPALICQEIIKQFVEGQGTKIKTQLQYLADGAGLSDQLDTIIDRVIFEVFNIAVEAWKPCPPNFPPPKEEKKEKSATKVVSIGKQITQPILRKGFKGGKRLEFARMMFPTVVAKEWRREFISYCLDRTKAIESDPNARQELWTLTQLAFVAAVIQDRERETLAVALLKMDGRRLPNSKEGFFLRSA